MKSGTRLGPYEIGSSIGAGGMGEVFRARDTRLNRDVAVKVLPRDFVPDVDRLRRFEQEAKTLAALNHPNVLTIHDAGVHEGAPYLVSELLEGRTLRQELGTGALSTRKATDYALQIAQGLAAAHGRGVVHRDLKPDNVFVTKDGRVKILDFGLAKLREVQGPKSEVQGPADPDASTLVQPAAETTEPGRVMGTPSYMAPEQVRGEVADHRADLFAFGCVLYEMVSGTRPFRRDTSIATMAAILNDEPPDLTAAKPDLPPALARIVHRCLEKAPDRRFQTASDLAFALESVNGSSVQNSGLPRPEAAPTFWRRPPIQFAAVLAGLSALLLLWRPWVQPNMHGSSPAAGSSTSRLHLPIAIPPDERLISYYAPLLAISPDGSRVAFASEDTNGMRHLWFQSLSDPRATLLAQTESAIAPFFSPDGKSIGYWFGDTGGIKVVSIAGGSPRKISDDLAAGGILGGCWSPEGGSIYAVPGWTSGVWKFSPTGMFPPERLRKTIPETERAHLWPDLSPDGKLLIYTVWNGGSFDAARIVVESMATGERSFIHVGASSAKFAGDDLIVFAQGGALLAAPFEASTRKLKAPPQAVLPGVMMDPRDGGGQYALTKDGTLVYLPGANLMLPRRVVRVDRTGRIEPWSEHTSDFVHPALSSDGFRMAIAQANSGELDIHVIERGRPLPLRLSLGGDDYEPTWSPDGRRVIWNSGREGEVQLYWRAADGSDQEERLTTQPGFKHESAFAPNGQAVAYTAPSSHTIKPSDNPSGSAKAGSDDIWILPLEGDRQPYPLMTTPANEQKAQFSPDGRWLAYASDETGRLEVWIQPLKINGASVQTAGPSLRISTAGGAEPRWSSDSRELFYREGQNFFAVASDSSTAFQPGSPKLMFRGAFDQRWSVEKDAQHFVLVERAPDYPRLHAFHYVEHWVQDVRRKLGMVERAP